MLHIRQLDPQRIAEFLQMIQHLVWPRSLQLNPALSFSPPLSLEELDPAGGAASQPGWHDILVAKAKALLAEHVAMSVR